jgi:hypothetical protein
MGSPWMTNRGGPRAAAIGIALALALSAAGAHAQARAPSADELKAARELFQEAYRDEQDKRFAQALEKFQRVAAVKESASVRYRIASVLGSLGRLREARDAFRALAGSKTSLPVNEQEIADSAAERAQALDRRIPRVIVQLQENPPPDARVTIDGAPIPASTTARPFEVDPGEHVVQGTAPTAQASETKVVLQEGGEVAVSVVLPPKVGRVKPLPTPTPVSTPLPTPEPDRLPRRDNTLAFVALGAGGVLLVTGIVLLGIREGDISDLNKACRPVCPSENRNELEATRDEAELLGPLGVGFAVAGLLATGAGAYLLFRPLPAAAAPAKGTTTSTPSGGLRIGPTPVRGGAVLGFGAAF